jgi:RecB family exonuclease
VRFSASRIQAYMACPLAAHYKYDLALPARTNAKAEFGKCIHGALQVYNDTGNLERARSEFLVHWAAADPDYWPRAMSFAGLRAQGLAILDDMHASLRFTKRTVLGTEIEFLVPFGDHELYGFIDLLELQKSGTGRELLRIVDYKSNSRLPTRNALALDPQFTTYSYAVARKEFWTGVPGHPELPGLPNGEWLWATVGSMATTRCIWYALMAQKELDAGPRTDKDFERLYRVCSEIDRSIQADIHVPMIGESCTYCDYVEPCALEIPVALAGLTDDNRWI